MKDIIISGSGIRLSDGVDLSDGIDLMGRSVKRIPNKRVKAEVLRKTFREPTFVIKHTRHKEEGGAPVRRGKRDRAVWTTTVTLSGDEITGKGTGSSPKKSKHQSNMALLVRASYERRCTVRIRYTSPGKGLKLNNRIAKYTDTSKGINNASYNSGMIGYISRHAATIDNCPEWSSASDLFPLYTFDENGNKIPLSTEGAFMHIGADPLFSIIISPEDSGCDLYAVSERIAKDIIKKTGAKTLNWVAANHHNTDHDHIHLLISRQNDKELARLPKEYVRRGLRKNCNEILTDLMGPRQWEEELRCNRKIATRTGFGEIDKKILAFAKFDQEHPGTIPRWRVDNQKDKHTTALMSERLNSYVKWNLATYSPNDYAWTIGKGIEKKLRILEFAESLQAQPEEIKDAIIDKRNTSYIGEILKLVRPDEDMPRVLMMIKDEKGRIHLREDEINEEYGENSPQGRIDVSKIRKLMHGMNTKKQRG